VCLEQGVILYHHRPTVTTMRIMVPVVVMVVLMVWWRWRVHGWNLTGPGNCSPNPWRSNWFSGKRERLTPSSYHRTRPKLYRPFGTGGSSGWSVPRVGRATGPANDGGVQRTVTRDQSLPKSRFFWLHFCSRRYELILTTLEPLKIRR